MKPMTAEEYQALPFEGYYADRWEFGKALRFLKGCKTILEVGCGDGRFLSIARKQGLQVVGLDLNTEAVNIAKQRSGSDRVYGWSIERFAKTFPHEKFDAVCAFHIVEHLEDPAGFMRIASAVLNPRGLFVAAVPNQKRQSLFYGERETWDCPPHHLTWWNKKSLGRLMELSGFDMIAGIDEPVTAKRTVEVMINRIRFGAITGIKKSLAGKRHDADVPAGRNADLASGILADCKRVAFYPAAIIWALADRCRGLTGRNMLIAARKKD
jgi:SAM-dependent methyltransferase